MNAWPMLLRCIVLALGLFTTEHSQGDYKGLAILMLFD